jgi:hypothetical protein
MIRLAILALICSAAAIQAAEPVTAKPPKKIYAHYMGCYSAGTGAIYYHSGDGHRAMGFGGNPKYGVELWALKSTGGQYRNFALAPPGHPLTLEQSADLEIRRAMRIGIDGFTFDAWAGGESAKQLFEAMFKICDEKNYPFELTLTIDASCIGGTTGLTNAYIDNIKSLLEKHGKSPHLARRNGKPLIMGYQSIWPGLEYIQGKVKATGDAWQAEVNRLRTSPEGWKMIGEAYHAMDQKIGEPIYWEFCMSAFFYGVPPELVKEKGGKKLWGEVATAIAKELPAIGFFMYEDGLVEAREAALAAGAEYSQPTLLQYENYGNWQGASKGTDWIRGDWQYAREKPCTLIQYITWNDYHENTNLSPGYNTRYAYYDLTGKMIAWWKTGTPPTADHDVIYIFSHKYTNDAKVYPFKVVSRADNVIEVVTILPKAAKVRMPGRNVEWDAPAGFSFKQVPLTAGPVITEVVRDGKVDTKLENPDPVSDRPFRQDTGKTAYSTEDSAHWKADFGDTKEFIYSEYGDADGNGLPNWFEMFWFGKFGDMTTATGTDPKGDPDGDGKTNLQEYLDQTNPTTPSVPGKLDVDPKSKPGQKPKGATIDDLIDGK